MSMIKVTAEELQSVSGALATAAQQIDTENAGALQKVNGLVGEGWAGAASSQFDQLFTDWKTSADQLQASLVGISNLLAQAGTQYTDTEQSITQSMQG